MKDTSDHRTESVIRTSNLVFTESIDANGNKVFLQSLINSDPGMDELLSLKNDFEISKKIQFEGVLKSRELVKEKNKVVVIKDCFSGITLKEFLTKNKLSIQQFLEIAIKLTGVINSLHENRIIHKDLRPENIFISENGMNLCISNFIIATQLAQEQEVSSTNNWLMGSLDYISPEQTGRMNRSIDYRSDFYSLGIILYEALCNRLPFQYNESIEKIHAHIARYPEEPSNLRPSIPRALSDIVMKLLAKNAEERYQSTKGLLHDLKECLAQWNQNQSIDNFEIAAKDFSPVLNISEKLYGREKEIDTLLKAFEKTRNSPPELLLIAGYSGIGKTRLINEIHKPVAAVNGYFCSGKFDQFNRDKPFSAFSDAIGSLIKQLLKGNKEDLEQWRNKILSNLEKNGQVLVEVFPELELLIGKQESVLKLGLKETNERFIRLFQKLLLTFSGNGRPIVFFIDDLQWADSGSFELIHKTLTNKDLQNILFVCAYRNNETSPTHPLMLMVDSIDKEVPEKTKTLVLEELNKEEVCEFIGDSLRLKSDEVMELTTLIMNKTGGNPYFIIQFIKKLTEENKITFSKEEHQWTWDIDAISRMNITENVVDLLISKILKLPEESSKILKLASCIGNSFDIKTMQLISEHDDQTVFEISWELINEGFIRPKSKWNKHAKDELFLEFSSLESDLSYDYFRFQHDKIQQAAYSLIPESEKYEIHFKLGMFLLEKYKSSPNNKLLFELLNHINYSTSLINSDESKIEIAELNLKAGEKAKQSNAYKSALNYFSSGMDLLKNNQSPDLFKKLLLGRSETEYLSGNHDRSEKLFDQALSNTESKIEKASILAEKMSLYENTNRQREAIKIAIEGLSFVGVKLPEKPVTARVLLELAKAKYVLRNKTIEDLKRNKKMDSEEMLIAMRILVNLWGPAYLFNQNLLALAILRMVILSTRFGNCSESALAYAFYGFVLSGQLKDYKRGHDFASLGMWLNEQFDDQTLRSKVYVIYGGCVAFWTVKRSDLLETLSLAHKVGVVSNDLIYASYAFSFYGKSNFFMGTNLVENRKQVDKFIQFTEQIQFPLTINYMKTLGRIHYDLTGEEPDSSIFLDAADKDAHLKQMEELAKKDGTPLFLATHYLYQGMGAYMLNDFKVAFEHLTKAEKYIEAVLGLEDQITQKLYLSLSSCALGLEGKSLSFIQKHKIRRTISAYRKLSQICPENYEAQYLILKAEWLNLTKKLKLAELTYGKARVAAKESGMTHMMALANEKSARFYFQLGLNDIATQFIRESYFRYDEWGAKTKTKALEREFANIDYTGSDELKVAVSETSNRSKNIDLQSIFNASTTISGEIVFDKLLEKLLKIIINNAGAQRVYLLMMNQGELKAEAYSDSSKSVKILNSLPYEQVNDIAKSIVQFVINSGETVILNDASKEQRFAEDSHIKSQKTKSVLVQPIKKHGKTLAVLYLENNITYGAFTLDRLELLNLLSGQMAISLENSSLYENLEQKVIERTKIIENQKTEIESEKEKAENLLLNILPQETADELKQTGKYRPRKYESVTIIFTDFEGFTNITEKLTTEELVDMIDSCYKGFDQITSKYNIEKIKTIGDSYMCVSGLPVPDSNHAKNAMNAAIEMHNFINEFNADRASKGLPFCALRIGMHSGSVAAGVVGSKKFAYDIWGDSVNIASRLESAGKVGTINISSSTYELVKGDFNCVYRGRIAVKNKEDIDMYFVDCNTKETIQPIKI